MSTQNIDAMQGALAEIKALAEKQAESFEVTRVETEKKLEEVLLNQHELGQKQAQYEAALSKITTTVPESKQEEIQAGLEHKAFDTFMRAGIGGWAEAKKQVEEIFTKASVMNTLSDPEGGYLALPAAMGGIIDGRVFESSPMRALADVISIGTGSFEAPHDDDEIDAYWTNEKATSVSSDTMEFNQIKIDAHGLDADVAVTQVMLDDAMINLPAYISQRAADKFARKEATAFIAGDGVASPRGILTYTAGTSTYAFGSIEQVVSGSAATVTADGLHDLQNSLKEAYQVNAKFLMKRATWGAIRKLKDGENNYLLGIAPMGLNGQGPNVLTLLDKPVFFADDMEALGANALSIAYGDFMRGYQIVDRVGIRVLANPFINRGRVVYQFNKRVGGGVKNFDAIKLQKCST